MGAIPGRERRALLIVRSVSIRQHLGIGNAAGPMITSKVARESKCDSSLTMGVLNFAIPAPHSMKRGTIFPGRRASGYGV